MAKRGRPKQRLFLCVKEIFINETGCLFGEGDYARREQLGRRIDHHFVEVDPQSHAVIQTFEDKAEEEEVDDADELRKLKEELRRKIAALEQEEEDPFEETIAEEEPFEESIAEDEPFEEEEETEGKDPF
jgi:hypothetical protein